jgi:hypothetical protein
MKYIYLSLFIILVYSGNAQTKLETEKWIISKFVKWHADYNRTEYWSHVPASLEIRDCKLIYKETIFTTQSISHQQNRLVLELEIGDIDKLFWIKNRLVLKSRKKNVLITSSQSRNRFGDEVAFNFDLEGEKDLDSRLLKAFKHLQTFCKPSKVEKEPF